MDTHAVKATKQPSFCEGIVLPRSLSQALLSNFRDHLWSSKKIWATTVAQIFIASRGFIHDMMMIWFCTTRGQNHPATYLSFLYMFIHLCGTFSNLWVSTSFFAPNESPLKNLPPVATCPRVRLGRCERQCNSSRPFCGLWVFNCST